MSAEGEPANPEDLLIAYALGVPYVGQHGDDRERWQERFGDLVVAPADSLGTAEAPRATRQHELSWAREVCDRVLSLAHERGVRVSVAVVDRGGDPVQQDGMDDAVAASGDVALATATTAARLGCPSHEVSLRFGDQTPSLGALHPSPFLAAPGGVPLMLGDRVVGGLGVGGIDPADCARLAEDAPVVAS